MKRATEKALKKMAGNGFPDVREALEEIDRQARKIDQLRYLLQEQVYCQGREVERLRAAICGVVRIADEAPFTAIGHVVEHALPELRDLAATRKVLGDE
jgi:hypothetical protein